MVIRTTPFAPRDPYIAVASASFNTSMLSILEIFKVLKGSIPEALVKLPALLNGSELTGIPSIIYNG